jgi:hypothetical protein
MHSTGFIHFYKASRLVLATSVLFLAPSAFGQQDYVGHYDIYGGYGYLNSPKISLAESGFHTQVGMRVRRWVSLGFDYTIVTGNGALTPNLLTTTLQQQLGPTVAGAIGAGLIPANYQLKVPLDSKTQTFSAGPQLSYRHFKQATLFVRPDLGAIYENATAKPTDAFATAIVQQLVPSGSKQDWTVFYGFGGGVDLIVSRRFSIRVQADFVHDHLFNDLLQDGRNTVRFAIGPGFQWGKNIE